VPLLGGPDSVEVLLSAKPRITKIRDNLIARIAEAEHEGLLGEVEGLKFSLAGAEVCWSSVLLDPCQASGFAPGGRGVAEKIPSGLRRLFGCTRSRRGSGGRRYR
jgi:hypothetical protein